MIINEVAKQHTKKHRYSRIKSPPFKATENMAFELALSNTYSRWMTPYNSHLVLIYYFSGYSDDVLSIFLYRVIGLPSSKPQGGHYLQIINTFYY